MSSPNEHFAWPWPVPGAPPSPSVEPEAASEHLSANASSEWEDWELVPASPRFYPATDTVPSAHENDLMGSGTGSPQVQEYQQGLGQGTPTLFHQAPDMGLPLPQGPGFFQPVLGMGLLPPQTSSFFQPVPGTGPLLPQAPQAFVTGSTSRVDGSGASPALPSAPIAAPLLGKRRQSDTSTTPVKQPKLHGGKTAQLRKPRMKGRKAAHEGNQPSWDRDEAYSVSILEYKFGQVKMTPFLESHGIDVKTMFPTARMIYKGQSMRRGTAMAHECRALMQASIDRRIATSQLLPSQPSTNSFDRIVEDAEEVTSEFRRDPEDSGHHEDHVFYLEDNSSELVHKAEATTVTRQALHKIRQAMLQRSSISYHGPEITTTSTLGMSSGSTAGNLSPHGRNVLDRLNRPELSQKAQDLVEDLVECQAEVDRVEIERLVTDREVARLEASVRDVGAYEQNRIALIKELSEFIQSHFETDGWDIATKLVNQEFPFST